MNILDGFDNLADIPIVGWFVRHRFVWNVARLVLLVLFFATIAFAWRHHNVPGVDVRDPLMYTNFGTFSFWVLWVMGIAFIALIAGRFWCAFCPLGWLNGIIARFGFKQKLPELLKGSLPVTLTLVAIQVIVYFWAAHRFPDYTAYLLAIFFLMLVVTALLFKGRAFCSLFCPAGALFSLYSRIVPFRLSVKNRDICGSCDSKSCMSSQEYWQTFSTSQASVSIKRQRENCPVSLSPEEYGSNPTCTFCLNCYWGCDKENVRFGFTSDRLATPELIGKGESFFFMVLLGLLFANFVKTNAPLREQLFYLPATLSNTLGFGDYGYYIFSALWVALIMPSAVIFTGHLVRLLGRIVKTEDEKPKHPSEIGTCAQPVISFGETLRTSAYLYLPLLLSIHLVLALVKWNAKGPYLPFVLGDTSGVRSYLAMNVMQTATQPGVIVSLDILKWLVLLTLVLGAGGSLLLIWRRVQTSKLDRFAYTVPLTILSAGCFATVIRWLFIR